MALKYVIIGAGPAAVNTAATLKKNDIGCSLTLICAERNPFYLKPTLVDYLTGNLSEEEIIQKSRFAIDEKDILKGKRACSVDADNNIVHLSSGEKIDYSYLIIASGAVPSLPEKLSGCASHIYTISTLLDAVKMKRKASASKSALVAGEGYVGIEMVRGLKKCGLDVTYVSYGEQLWRENEFGVSSDEISAKLKNEKIKVILEDEIIDILEIDADRYSVITKNGKEIECNMVVAGYGFKPNIGFLKDSAVKTERGILVNEELRSSISNVFAAGDVAQVYDINKKINRNNFGWSSAWQQGEICAKNILGEGTFFISDEDKFFNRLIGKKILERW